MIQAVLRAAQESKEREIELDEYSGHYLQVVDTASQELHHFFENIYYIGPLRERPSRIYEASSATPPDVGTRGEYAPDVIFQCRSSDTLAEVSRWLEHFDFASGVQCTIQGEGVFSLDVRRHSPGAPTINFADTGFGMSQVLPLIVQSVYAPERSLIIAEQPEIHLNPRLQTKLADLFCDTAISGRSILVETHSEHVLLRLRLLVAQGKIPASDVALYYVEKQEQTCTVREVPIQPNGHIDAGDWPRGFFDESLTQALELALSQARTPAHVG